MKITKLQNYKITKLQNYKITKLQNYKVTKLQSYKVTKLQSYNYNYKITIIFAELQNLYSKQKIIANLNEFQSL